MLKRIAIWSAVALFVGACVCAWAYRQTGQAAWIHATTSALRDYSGPSTSLKPVRSGEWVVNAGDHGYMLFSDGWAIFVAHTFHESERIGDVALLRTSDGGLYISHFHFCVGVTEYVGRPRPQNIQDFLRKYGGVHGWKRIPNS